MKQAQKNPLLSLFYGDPGSSAMDLAQPLSLGKVPGVLGSIFIGPKAKTWSKWIKKGAPVLRSMADEVPRIEIPDLGFKAKTPPAQTHNFWDYWEFRDLIDAYPEVQKLDYWDESFAMPATTRARVRYRKGRPEIAINVEHPDMDVPALRRASMLHELMHLVQGIEGMSSGAGLSPLTRQALEWVKFYKKLPEGQVDFDVLKRSKIARNLWDRFGKGYVSDEELFNRADRAYKKYRKGYDVYAGSPGEREARLVSQKRRDWPLELLWKVTPPGYVKVR
jgi:hypothetical protein